MHVLKPPSIGSHRCLSPHGRMSAGDERHKGEYTSYFSPRMRCASRRSIRSDVTR